MKGFKSTGKGPKYGSFTFPSKAGFGPSSGKVKSISGYSRRAPKRTMRKAVGGIVEDNIVEGPGFSDFSKGGKVAKAAAIAKRATSYEVRQKALKKSQKEDVNSFLPKTEGPGLHQSPLKRARGGRVPGVSNPMTAREAMAGSVGFNRTPKIGK